MSAPLTVAGLFSGIGGIELGFHRAGLRSQLLCELDDIASSILVEKFDSPIVRDIRDLRTLPQVDVVAAGFPCQDLSQAGKTLGIAGARSGLVGEVFRLLESANPTWVVLENVPFMLRLDRGRGMSHLATQLEALGYRWAYRLVDTRAFGLPQRRQRILLVASRTEDPREVLFADDGVDSEPKERREFACGFYWTEGYTGLGWAVDAVPTLKCGSSVGIASPPAVWRRDGTIGVPDIRDAERLQGFPRDWTSGVSAAGEARRRGARWRLVGNAVSVPVAEWLGRRLIHPGPVLPLAESECAPGKPWPSAAYSMGGRRVAVECSKSPVNATYNHLEEFLEFSTTPLSTRAASGFLSRARRSSLRFPEGLLEAIESQLMSTGEIPESA